MNVAAFVRVALEHFRHQGLDFTEAWVRTLQSLPRGGQNLEIARERREWVAALKWARPAWQAAYDRMPLEEYLPRPRARSRATAPLELELVLTA